MIEAEPKRADEVETGLERSHGDEERERGADSGDARVAARRDSRGEPTGAGEAGCRGGEARGAARKPVVAASLGPCAALAGVLAVASCLLFACDEEGEGERERAAAGEQAAAPPEPSPLPPPYGHLSLGMTRAELAEIYPPEEDTSDCRVRLVGEASSESAPVPGEDDEGDEGPHARCVDESAIQGATDDQLMRQIRVGVTLSGTGRRDLQVADLFNGLVRGIAQVRGAARAGVISDQEIYEANGETGVPAYEGAFRVGSALALGTLTFTEGRRQLRFLAATITDDCDRLDPDRVAAFLRGEYGRSEIRRRSDRAAYRCGRRMRRAQDRLGGELLALTGGLGGVGLSRGLRGEGGVDPDDPRSFRELRRRADLTTATAALAVQIANHLDEVEAYWSGAVQLSRGESKDDPLWGSAVAWLEDDRVTRILVNVRDHDRVGELRDLVAEHRGEPGTTEGPVTTWPIDDDTQLRLDVGAPLALVLERRE